MTLKEIVELLPKNKWIEYLNATPDFKSKISGSKKKIVKEVLAALETEVEKSRVGKATQLFFFGIYIDKEYFLGKVKQKGILRHSNYINKKNLVFHLVNVMLENSNFLKLSPKEINYFSTLNYLKEVYHEQNLLHNYVVQFIKKRRKIELSNRKKNKHGYLIATMLAYNELNFLTNYTRDPSSQSIGELGFYSKEEISEAISYMVSLWEETFELNKFDVSMIDYQLWKSKDFEKLILSGCIIKFFRENEIRIESLGYYIGKDNDSLLLKYPSELFGISFELGLLQNQFQEQADLAKFFKKNEDTMSLEDIAKIYFKEDPSLIELKYEPYPRYRFKILSPVVAEFCKIDFDAAFPEEALLFENISKNLLLPINEFDSFMLKDNISLLQFLRLFKFFIFLHTITAYYLLPKIKEKEEIVYNSISPLLKEDDLYEVLIMVEPEKVVSEFLDLMTWEAGHDKYLDLQYTPLLFVDGYYSISPSLMYGSKFSRNLFPSESKQKNLLMVRKNESYDKLIKKLVDGLNLLGFEVHEEIPIKYKKGTKKESDIDVGNYIQVYT